MNKQQPTFFEETWHYLKVKGKSLYLVFIQSIIMGIILFITWNVIAPEYFTFLPKALHFVGFLDCIIINILAHVIGSLVIQIIPQRR